MLAASIAVFNLALGTLPVGATPVAVPQGPNWTPATRLQFYSQDQGSQIMPLIWFLALKQPSGKPFLGASLSRYGYLPNPASPTPGLPVGFTVNGSGNSTMIGMTCAACHTRQIVSGGISYRIDGGPAIVDFQHFLADLDTAVATVLNNGAAFTAFANAVLGPSPPPAQQAALKAAVQAWFLRFDTLIKGALPTKLWGPGRLDAVAMIFNRLTGLDLGPPPSYLIPGNIQKAVAPVRYPFLWNAAIQDHTQWPGFASNGNAILGLGRNLGEVYGVFGTFAPQKAWYGIDYLAINSANFPGLFALESLIKKIGPPQWPWTVNNTLANQGEAIFNRPTANGGCVDCHGIKPGITRPIGQKTWATPVLDVGTDTREYDILGWTAQSGVMNGAYTAADFDPDQAGRLGDRHSRHGGGRLDRAVLPGEPGHLPGRRQRPWPATAAEGRRPEGHVQGFRHGGRLRVAGPAGHLGSRPLPAQRLGADAGAVADAAGAAGEVVRGRIELRPGQYRARDHADAVQLCLPGDRLRQSQLGQQQLRSRLRDHAVGREQAGVAGVSEDAVKCRRAGTRLA